MNVHTFLQFDNCYIKFTTVWRVSGVQNDLFDWNWDIFRLFRCAETEFPNGRGHFVLPLLPMVGEEAMRRREDVTVSNYETYENICFEIVL